MRRAIALFAFVPALFLLFGVSATKPSKEIRPISSASVTHGDTRVTLLHIARITSISKQYVRGDKVEIRIQTGFDGKNEWFAFQDVPLYQGQDLTSCSSRCS